jgi:hypothetical protein
MIALTVSRSALRDMIMRAVVLWALLRALVTAVMLMGSVFIPVAEGTTPHRASGPSPIAVVILCALLGMIDLRRRHESALWANLGVSSAQLALLFTVTAIAGEIVLALVS